LHSTYRISTDTQEMDITAIHDFLTTSYWAKSVPRSVVARAISNSICFGVFQGPHQVGFARTVTDSATFAYLADVYILEAHRGKGLGKQLVQEVLAHPQLQGLRRMLLATRDAHSLYSSFGFSELEDATIFMERWDPNVYSS
jgi:N-acetylglutamate synthase-like GNAT family acetyltransferase